MERPAFLFGCGMLAVAVAGVGEALIRSTDHSGWGRVLYLFGIVLFARGAWPIPERGESSSEAPVGSPAAEVSHDETRGRRRGLTLLLVGTVVAIGINLAMLFRLNREITSGPTVLLWILSAAILLAAGVIAGTSTSWTPRWNALSWPTRRNERIALLLLLGVLLSVAVASRFLRLDEVPFGINADEGDRAALAIQIARGQNTTSVFGTGWYHISMVYFKLLAGVMQWTGLDFSGARVLGAICGVLTFLISAWIAFRHFGWRAGLATSVILSTLGVALQFSRETTEATPTMTLWALSVAFFLEATRGGKAWAWIGAGIAGGASVYFYPTGRLWPLLAGIYCAYLFVRGPQRGRIALGVFLSAIAAILVASPFLLHVWKIPNELVIRARETSIFIPENPRRLPYYQPGWTFGELLRAQLDHSIGIFNKYTDQNYFWPTHRPLLPPPLAVLTLLGLGAVTVRAHDRRLFLLALWFWIGFLGVIVTVETPNLQRMATAIPLLALFPALVLDDLARRAESLVESRGRRRWMVHVAATFAATLTAGVLAWREGDFYFRRYAAMDGWPYTRVEGQTVAHHGRDALVVSLASHFHMVNSGWVRLLAPLASRGGILSPGSQLPPSIPAERDLVFLLYPNEAPYLPFLTELLPGGTRSRISHPPDVFMFDLYRVPRALWRERQGALVLSEASSPVRVATLGLPPPGWTRFPSAMRWTASLRVDRYWNYGFRIGPGPARLILGGKEVLRAREGEETAETRVSLARGDHQIVYEGVSRRSGESARLEWERVGAGGREGMGDTRGWRTIPTVKLQPIDRAPAGLFGTIEVPGRPPHYRLDPAIATGGLCEEIEYCEPFGTFLTSNEIWIASPCWNESLSRVTDPSPPATGPIRNFVT
ncbi:MAG: glycosyltransferase family 39 protein, partial [Acidobacteriota bacterium]|nr:glycosyltransferase family 39 protein [Acidobacteriota bacterium]